MKKGTRDLLIASALASGVLIIGFALLEHHYYNELMKMDWLPKTELNKYPYGRKINGYTVRQNTPNYTFDAYDEQLKPASAQTDSNGFLTDGPTLQKSKDSGTIRIFVTGGSVAWGIIEARSKMHDTTYPTGSYCYKASIAGKLKAMLCGKYPRQKFEVVNAAVPGFRFHQSLAMYYEKLHDFNPDVIINIDGYNDHAAFVNTENDTDPYGQTDDQLEEELETQTMARLPQRPYMLAFYYFKNMRQQATPRKTKKVTPAGGTNNKTVIEHEPRFESYRALRKVNTVSKKLLWLIDCYEARLHADGVYSVFCLQPMLQRRVYQKELSPYELRCRNFVEQVTVADTLKMKPALDEFATQTPAYKAVFDEIGIDKYYIKSINNLYAFNELSPILDSLVSVNGGAYVDVNKALPGIGADKEFYTDYCHLTPYGNAFVARQLLDKLEAFMAKRQ